jgi:hypothetical protein
VRLSSACLLAAAVVMAAVSSRPALSVQMPDSAAVIEGMEGSGPQSPGGCGCQAGAARSYQQPPWHGTVSAAQAGCGQPTCRGSNVFQAHPCAQLHWRETAGCGVTLPSCLPRLTTLFREGYMPSPTPPALPRCHQCGSPIAGGF